MKERKLGKLAFAAIALAATATVFWFVGGDSSGPSFEGKSTALWLQLYRSSSLTEQEDARDAFKALGDEAVPYLLGVVVHSDRSFLARSYEKLWSRLPSWLRKILPPVSRENAEGRAALELLQLVRPSAKVLMPRLTPWLLNPQHKRYLWALNLLGWAGSGGAEGVPFLVRALQSTNQYHRRFAVQSLQYLGAEARAAVPALIAA